MSRIKVNEDRGDNRQVTAAIEGHELVPSIRLAGQGGLPEVQFNAYFPESLEDKIIERRDRIRAILKKAHIETKEPKETDYAIALKNNGDLPGALEALGFDKASAGKVSEIQRRSAQEYNMVKQQEAIADELGAHQARRRNSVPKNQGRY